MDTGVQLHAWCALLAYATLAVAALLAIMLWLQERALRRRDFHAWLRVLPPLTELEILLFRTITAGFVLLTATLLRSEEHTSELQSLMRISYAVFCLKKKKKT